jgi:spore coat protein U-like protein
MSEFRPTGLLGKLAAVLVCLAPLAASAAVTCNITLVSSITTVYDPTIGTDNVTTGSWSFTCTRLGTDPNTFAWQFGANNGIHAAGAQNRVLNGAANLINYEPYRIIGGPYTNANRWQDAAATRFNGTLNFGASLTATQSGSFDLRVTAGQTGHPAGSYTDTVTTTLRNSGGTAIDTQAFTVTVITNNTCQISVPPGDVNFTYTSFQGSAAAANTLFGVRCTSALPYTMALDATSGTLLGLNYTLALSSPSGTGSGLTQTYNINGSIAAGQAGTCATAVCNGSQTRTLTLTW